MRFYDCPRCGLAEGVAYSHVCFVQGTASNGSGWAKLLPILALALSGCVSKRAYVADMTMMGKACSGLLDKCVEVCLDDIAAEKRKCLGMPEAPSMPEQSPRSTLELPPIPPGAFNVPGIPAPEGLRGRQ